MHTYYHAELQRYSCLQCDDCFYLAVEEELVCPQCGNRDEQAFSDATPAEDVPVERFEMDYSHVTFQP